MKIVLRLFLLFFLLSANKIHLQTSNNYSFLYVSGSGDHGIYLAQKDVSGKWKRGSKIIINGKFDGNAVDPDIVKLSDGSYRLYYYKGYFITPPPPGFKTHEIFCAVSYDGKNYSNETKVFEADNITDPTITILNDGNYLLAAVRGQEIIFAKSSNGLNFNSTGSNVPFGGIPELLKLENGNVRLFYNGPGGIASHISTDNGLTWQKENGVRLATTIFVADPSVIKIGSKYIMFVKSFNNTGVQNPAGHNVWKAESNDGFSFNLIYEVLLDSASVPEGIVLSEQTSINYDDKIPNTFRLFQNYPNPFNPTTIIQFVIPSPSSDGQKNLKDFSSTSSHRNDNPWVTLKIYDILGKEVATLVDEYKLPGTYNYEWRIENSELPSGIYFYQLRTSDFSKTNKMILLK